MKLTVVRHGQTLDNIDEITMVQLEGTLSDRGIAQAKKLAEHLKSSKFNQVWSSDLKRCVDTSKYILELHPDLKLQLTKALREANYGTFQGRPSADIQPFLSHGQLMSYKPPGGESHQEMFKRVIDFVNYLFKQYPNQNILLITHSGPIEAIRASVNKSLEEDLYAFELSNAGFINFDITTELHLYPKP